MEKNYTGLHVHSGFSFLDGMCKFEELIPRAKALGMTAIALTDHNHLGGCLEFQKVCKKEGLKPILGYEAYYTDDTSVLSLPSEDRNRMAAEAALNAEIISEEEFNVFMGLKNNAKITKSSIKEKIKPFLYDTKQHHIIFLAMNQKGWQNLVKLQSESADICTFNGRFICDNKLIAKYSEGVICSTACIANRIARLINIEQNYAAAEKLLLEWHKIFGDRFYLEIQPICLLEQCRVNAFYLEMSDKYNIPIIATNDTHYVYESDWEDHDTLLCIGTGARKDDIDRMRYTNDFWLRSYDEMVTAFKRQYDFDDRHEKLFSHDYLLKCMNALEETNRVADRVEADIKMGSDKMLIPQVKLEEGKTPAAELRVRCFSALYRLAQTDEYVKDNIKVYEKRLAEEMKVIIPKGFADYLLVVDELIHWANANGISTGPGRGSAAGSLCLYLLGITKVIDPIKYDLLFSRFLTAERVSPPDIDSDYSYSGRDRVVHHLEEYYGPECVAHIGTYTVMGVKSGLKDVGRVLNIPFDTMNDISKQLDEIMTKPQPKFKDFDELKLDENPGDLQKWEKFHKLEEANSEIFRLARRYEGLRRNFGVHASGILAMPMPVNELMPTRVADGVRVCLMTGPEAEELGTLKLDILGLKTLDIIDMTLKHIDKDMTYEDLYTKINVNDLKVFDMLCEKKTDAVFQLESDMFKGMVGSIQPTGLDDIIAITSLGRPGPLSAHMDKQYARRKNGEEECVPLLRGMEDILDSTYGEIVYQEQIMRIGVKAFGFDMNQADSIIRKIFAKKKKDKMEALRRMMTYGKVNTEGPAGWKDNPKLPWFDPEGREYGREIAGGIANGYSEDEMNSFWQTIQGFADYLFNLSHAACYSYISLMTAWLKAYYPVEFFASVLSVQEEDKTDRYVSVCEEEGIKVIVPDINKSEEAFTPDAGKKQIYYGLSSIKGVGESALKDIIANQPYSSLEDIFEKLPKKSWNKRVAEAMAKSGALDSFASTGMFGCPNRYQLLNKIHELRKDKSYDVYLEEGCTPGACMEFEKSTLSACITYKPWWYTVKTGEKVSEQAYVVAVREQVDKNKNLMAFATLRINDCVIDAVIFASVYKKCVGAFDFNLNPLGYINVSGKKDEKGQLIVNKVNIADV